MKERGDMDIRGCDKKNQHSKKKASGFLYRKRVKTAELCLIDRAQEDLSSKEKKMLDMAIEIGDMLGIKKL
jgi:hypothetical protein